jgi:hypothetical protein
MLESNAYNIVKNALDKDELDLLLLGKPEYCYMPRWTTSPLNTNLVELLTTLYEEYGQYHHEDIKERLCHAITKIVSTYDGLIPVANCILLESSRRKKDNFSLDLPLEEIAIELNESIKEYYSQLREDKSGAGNRWDDGLLGELRRLNKITVKQGGPSIFR